MADILPYGLGSPAEMAGQPSGMAGLLGGAYDALGLLAKRAFGASEMMRTQGPYDPAPMVDAAMLPMGTGAIAGVPLRAGEIALGSGPLRAKVGGMDRPSELYHVVGPDYVQGEPLRTLYSRLGNDAYDVFAKRWPEAGDLGQYHAHRTFFYDKASDAAEHADVFGGKVLRVDPTKIEDLYLDTLEKSHNRPGFWATKSDVPADALIPEK